MRRAVFLDRDGVLNRPFFGDDGVSRPPAGVEEFEILPGVVEACETLKERGFLLVVVTNQPDVARGIQERSTVEAINRELAGALSVDDIRVCFHDSGDACACRKPAPGLLIAAAREWSIDLGASVMVGDRATDIEAGRRAGCRTVLVGGGDADVIEPGPDLTVGSLVEAVACIVHDASALWAPTAPV